MKEPNWVTKEECLAFHSMLIARFGGVDGIRDESKLDAPLNRPPQKFHYETPTLFQLAATYASGIVKSQPFIDGNKHTGLMAAVIFIESNGYQFNASEEEAAVHILALADSRLTDPELTDWLARSYSVKK